jgi:class 3 adenylate cyclase
MRLRLSRHLQPFGLLRRFPIAERPHFGPEHALRFAELLHEFTHSPGDPERHVRLLAERAQIEELAGRTEVAGRTYDEAVRQAAVSVPALVPELRYYEAKLLYRCSDYAGAQALLESVIEAPGIEPLLRRRAFLHLGRVELHQGRYADAIEALTRGLDGPNSPSNVISGSLDLVFAHIHQAEPRRASAVLAGVQEMIAPGDHIGRAAIHFYTGWLELIQAHLAAARTWFESARDKVQDATLLNSRLCAELALAYLEFRSGRLKESLAVCDRISALSAVGTRSDLALSAHTLRARILWVTGRYSDALAYFERTREEAATQRLPAIECRSYEGMAEIHTLAGEALQARNAIEQSLRLRRQIGDPLGECSGLLNLAWVERERGALDQAAIAVREARAVATRIGNRIELARTDAEEAELLISRGDFAEAAASALRAANQFEAIGVPIRVALAHCTRARALALHDQTEEALELLRVAEKIIAHDPCQLYQAEIKSTQAEVLADSGAPERAVTLLDEARQLAAESGAQVFVEDLRRATEELREREFARKLLERYLDARVVARLLARPERRIADNIEQTAAILFSDIRGYTTVSEKLSPQEVVAMLNEHFGAMTEAVQSYGGVIDKFMGDAIMVVFGDPGRPRPDDAARAVQAGVEMTRRRHAMNLEREARGLPPVRIGVGIHIGPVIMGHIGSRHRMNYTVIGDAVNVAARLETATKEYGRTILVSEEVARATGQEMPVEPIGAIQLKGRKEPVRVFALTSAEV